MSNTLKLTLLACWLTLPILSWSQAHHCATVRFNDELRQEIPAQINREAFEAWLQRATAQADFRNGLIITIPVVVHVIHNGEAVGDGANLSEEQIYSQFEVLNEDFRRLPGTPGFNESEIGADVGVEFCPATVDPDGNVLATPGIHRIDRRDILAAEPPFDIVEIQSDIMPAAYWNPTEYLNIYTMPGIRDRNITNVLGFAAYPNSSTLPGIPGFFGPEESDGVVVTADAFGRKGNLRRNYNQGRTTTHEVGHWLGLIHIWGDGDCSVDDFCADTPPADGSSAGCPDELLSCGEPRLLANYMDYTDDRCMNLFTACQAGRMQTVIEFAERRGVLANSTACREVAPLPAFEPNIREVCAGNPVYFSDRSSQSPTAWSWSFPGGTPSTAADSIVSVIYDQPGTYDVTLTVSNDQGSRSITRTEIVRVIEPGETTLFYENFEDGLDRWTLLNPDEQTTWKLTQPRFSPGTDDRFSATVNFYDYLAGGERDELISPVFDLSYYQAISLSFDYAYRPANFGSRDSLQVWISVDSGQTFPYRVFPPADLGPRDFATGERFQESFDPANEEDWCLAGEVGGSCPEIDLSIFAGEPNLRMKFLAICGSDNNIYVDNILLTANCQDEPIPRLPIQQFFDFTIAPNTNFGQFSIKFSLTESSIIQIRGRDLLGREIYFEEEMSGFGPQTRLLDWGHISPGFYYVEVWKDNEFVGKKPMYLLEP